MCTRPIEKDGNTFACGTCNDCLSVRRKNWVARAMAEKTDWPHVVCVTLTYSDATPEGRQGARMFCYADVRAFVQRLTSRCRFEARKAKANKMPRVRFMACGEQGDRNGRCHWHLILYSDMDLTKIGTFWGMKNGRKVVVTDRSDIVSSVKKEKRLDWSMWVNGKTPFGFVHLFDADERGMNYVLAYCLKDQFTNEKSRETMREHKAENFATGSFKMSKRPPIGENWLMREMEVLEAKGAVLPALNLKVPGFRGYWQPSASFRQKLLWCLVALNQRRKWATGANAPQWSSLLASCKDNAADMEILNGPQEKKPDYAAIARKVGRFAEAKADWREERDRLWKGPCRCRDCLATYSEERLAECGIYSVAYPGGVVEYYQESGAWWPDIACKYLPDGP